MQHTLLTTSQFGAFRQKSRAKKGALLLVELIKAHRGKAKIKGAWPQKLGIWNFDQSDPFSSLLGEIWIAKGERDSK